MNIVNCTPHPVVFIPDGDKPNRIIRPSGTIPRVAEKPINWTVIDGVQSVVLHDLDIRVAGLPAPAADTMYIVSRLVFDAADDRADLAVPYDFIRDADGRIVGCRKLLVRTPVDAEVNHERHVREAAAFEASLAGEMG